MVRTAFVGLVALAAVCYTPVTHAQEAPLKINMRWPDGKPPASPTQPALTSESRGDRLRVEMTCRNHPSLCPQGPQAENWHTLAPRALAFSALPQGRQADLTKGWPIECRHDAIYDTKSCTMSRGSLYVMMIKHPKGNIRPSVSILHGDSAFPGRTHAMRVDSLAPHTATTDAWWSGSEATRVITQLMRGQTARTRFVAWPYGRAIDDEIPLDGFASAWQELQHAIRQP